MVVCEELQPSGLDDCGLESLPIVGPMMCEDKVRDSVEKLSWNATSSENYFHVKETAEKVGSKIC